LELVYCGGCGRVLREDDFSRGRARVLDNRPWCEECKPPEKTPIPIPAQGRRGSSAKLPRVSSGPLPRVAGAPTNRAMVLGLAVGGAVLLLIVLALGSRSAPPPPPASRTPSQPLPPAPPDFAEAERTVRDLESFAALASPDKILARCDEAWPKVRNTPHEKRFQAVEAAARDRKKILEQEVRQAAELEAIQKLIDEDPRFTRADEVIRRLKAARADRRLADYEASRGKSPHEKRAGPYGADPQGYLLNWLVLGSFPNEQDRGLDTDFLNGETTHDPVAGLQVGGARWAAYASPEPKVNFFSVPHLVYPKGKDDAVAYAACLLQVSVQVAAEFRLGSNDGFMLWVDGKPSGKVHKSRGLVYDNDRYAIPLSPGFHRVLMKVDNHTKSFEFALRIVDANGNRVPSLRVWN
jgi:hypothetical protein